MNITKQCCTLEQAKKLKKLGIDQKTSFYYVIRLECTHPEMRVTRDMAIDAGDISYEGSIYQEAQFDYTLQLEYGDITKSDCEYYSAFSVAELGVMVTVGDRVESTVWGEGKFDFDVDGKMIAEYDTEAECRAAMLIYLLENNLTTPEEVNNRLLNA